MTSSYELCRQGWRHCLRRKKGSRQLCRGNQTKHVHTVEAAHLPAFGAKTATVAQLLPSSSFLASILTPFPDAQRQRKRRGENAHADILTFLTLWNCGMCVGAVRATGRWLWIHRSDLRAATCYPLSGAKVYVAHRQCIDSVYSGVDS